MNLIELHMLQSFPVTCLNRDQFGSPKSVVFGGASRARVSSQCWKRAIRLFAKDECDMFSGSRSLYFKQKMSEALVEKGLDEAAAKKAADEIAEQGGIKDKALFYFSMDELSKAADAFVTESAAKKKAEKAANVLKDVMKDGVDIAFFGRMVANCDALTLEGAAMFSHAISVNKVDNDLDYYAAVDDLKPKEESGSAMIGDIEFNSACYYRYVALNLDLLADKDHLGALSIEERKQAVAAFLKACVMANPSARKNSMMGFSLPGFILGISRKGSPLTLVNAFETPVKGIGLLDQAKAKMTEHWSKLKDAYGIGTVFEKALPDDVNLKTMIEGLTGYVK